MRASIILIICLLGLFFSLATPEQALAAKVRGVKGKRVAIDPENDKMSVGQFYLVIGKNGKSKGILKVQKVTGKTVFGVLGKGKASTGDRLRLRERRQKTARSATPQSSPAASSPVGKSYWGVMAGVSQNSATVNLRDSGGSPAGTVELSGSGISLKGLFDYPLLPWLWFRALGGMEQFIVGGANNAVCGTECNAEITYITADFWGRIPFGSDTFKMWVGGGFDLLFPMSKSATALNEGSITNTSIIGVGGGFDWFLSPSSFIPVQIEYGLYPSSDQVKANAMMIRFGYGTSF